MWWNRFVAALFYALAVNYVLHGMYLHGGPEEIWFESEENGWVLTRELLYTVLGAGSLMLALLAEMMIGKDTGR